MIYATYIKIKKKLSESTNVFWQTFKIVSEVETDQLCTTLLSYNLFYLALAKKRKQLVCTSMWAQVEKKSQSFPAGGFFFQWKGEFAEQQQIASEEVVVSTQHRLLLIANWSKHFLKCELKKKLDVWIDLVGYRCGSTGSLSLLAESTGKTLQFSSWQV